VSNICCTRSYNLRFVFVLLDNLLTESPALVKYSCCKLPPPGDSEVIAVVLSNPIRDWVAEMTFGLRVSFPSDLSNHSSMEASYCALPKDTTSELHHTISFMLNVKQLGKL